jgi:hypothetical protein
VPEPAISGALASPEATWSADDGVDELQLCRNTAAIIEAMNGNTRFCMSFPPKGPFDFCHEV